MKYVHDYKSRLDPNLTEKADLYFKHLIGRVRETAYTSPLDFIALPYDKKQIAFIKNSLQSLKESPLRYIFVIGIGGSALGAKAIEKAFARDISSGTRADIIFLEDCDERFLHVLEILVSLIDRPVEFAIVYVSKSGATLETSANADALFSIMTKRFGNVFNRTVVVTDYGSPLHRLADEMGTIIIPMPKSIGGRFSVFSPAGLVPLYLAGFDIEELLAGATKAINLKTSGMSTILLSALYAGSEAKSGKAVRDIFIFAPELEDLGKWWRQLVAESLGKASPNGSHMGIIPTVSIGSHDLHSMAQRYFGGRDDFFTTLVHVENRGHSFVSGHFTKLLSQVSSHPISGVENALYKAARETFVDLGINFDEFEFRDISLEELGMFMQFKMIETVILGHIAGVNAFDQPDVEGYKKKTKSILK